MKALSVRQPWAWAILFAGKDVENRDWKSPWAPMEPLLLHAAKGCTYTDYLSAAATIEQISGKRPPPFEQLPRGGIVGRFRIAQAVRHAQPTSPWAIPGQVHLHLADVTALPFVEMPGQLGFFEVPRAVLDQLFPQKEQMGLFGVGGSHG